MNRSALHKLLSIIISLSLLIGLLPIFSFEARATQEVSDDGILRMQYDDHLDLTGKVFEILDAGSFVSNDGKAYPVLTRVNDFLVATGVGEASVNIDNEFYTVTVGKAKLNLVVIMGQSNAGNHFANATSDVTCPPGTAYWWGNGQGTDATEPVSYTAPSMGFHTPLLAELYAQSVANGDPVKNVMIWHEGITSKNGKSIVEWAKSETNTQGTDDTVTMIENCRSYYARNHDKFEIVSSGVYWLQGESDLSRNPEEYTRCFMAMWQRLKNAGMEYLAFFRVRKATSNQSPDRDDLDHTASLSAQIRMINENPEFFMATDLTENWVGTPEVTRSIDISEYHTVLETYGSSPDYADSYGNTASYADGILTTNMKALYGANNVCHYGKFGYGLIAADAAVNMYKAFHTTDYAIVQTNTSGHAGEKTVSAPGTIVTVDISEMIEDLSFRADCGSAAGTLSLRIYSQGKDITAEPGLVHTTGLHYGSVNTEKLKSYDNAQIIATYKTVSGSEGSVTYRIDNGRISLRYDDRYDVAGKNVEIMDAGTPASYQVGYGIAENTVKDTAVVTLVGNQLIATGIGSAEVKIDDKVYTVTVEAAPLSLLLLIGQSNMEGNEGEAKESIVCPDGMVYATYGDRYDMTLANATHYAPSALTGEYRTVNAVGGTDGLCDYPVYMLTDEGNGRKGPDSGFAYEWVKQTGEKAWIVNASHGGTSLNVWQPGTTQYEECEAMLGACQDTLRKEIAAGHFTLSHMLYFWCQGCNDYNQTAKWYVEKYLNMHENLNKEMCFDHDGDSATPAKTFEMGGIIPVRAGHEWFAGYRSGSYADTTNKSYYESFLDLEMTGPRVAQYWMCNNPELPDLWNVCNIGEDWVWMSDGTNGVSSYFQSQYPNGRVDYTIQVPQKESWYTPTTPAAVHDSIHYNQIGYNEVGRVAARNALIILGEMEKPEQEATVEFLTWDGYTKANQIMTSTTGQSQTLVVPVVSPVWKSKEVTYTLTEGLRYEYYDLTADRGMVSGRLTANGASGAVAVEPRKLTSFLWNYDGTALVSDPSAEMTDNPLKLLGGKIDNDRYVDVRYQLKSGIVLLHDQIWSLEFQIANWNATAGSMILAGGSIGNSGQPYVYIRPTDFFVGIGYYDGSVYHNYGISLKDKIACNEGEHTYRLTNYIAEDGTNSVLLYVDGQQIGFLDMHYINSQLTDTDDSWFNGRDFTFNQIGTSDFTVKGCTLNYIHVRESNATEQIHVHRWSAWKTVTEASSNGPGSRERNCLTCPSVETQTFDGPWQELEVDIHLSALPENLCSGVNLWNALEPERCYFHSGVRWDQNGEVHSVTIPVNPGDQIFATSFGTAAVNGSGKSNGIRVTFFGNNGIVKTMDPATTYAEFSTNGGYLIVPEGAAAVNVPMYNNSDKNELYILNAEHSYHSEVTLPTCTEQGYTTYTCACGHSYKDDYVAAFGHKAAEDKAVEATCTTTGLTAGTHCSVCDVVTKPQETVPAKGHSWDNGTVTKPATETAEGVMTYQCTACGETKTASVPKLDHTHKHDKAITDPTCTDQGYTTYTCTCGDSYVDDYVVSVGHKAVEEKAIEATCTATGLTAGSHCSVCGVVLKIQETVPAKGHSWDNGTVTKPATETEEGVITYQCTACGETKTNTIPKLDHTHKYEKQTTEPACTEQGYTTYTCACGDTYKDAFTDPKGHTLVTDKGREATCTETGLTDGSHCSVCNAVIVKPEVIPAKPHSWKGATCQTPRTCGVCGKTEGDPLVHRWNAATCESPKTCADCGKVEGSALLHWWVDATCQTPKTCKVCGKTEGSVSDHQYLTETIKPTCTRDGYTTHRCIWCDDTKVTDEVPATGHSFSAWRTYLPATCEEEGVRGRGCACGEVEMEPIPVIDHTYENGKCTVCGHEIQIIVPGDADGDGEVTYLDAMLALQAAVGLTEASLDACDADGDGEITYLDAMLILQAAVGLITL